MAQNHAYLKDNIFGGFFTPKNLTYYETKKDQIILLDSSITYVNNKQFLVMNYVLDAKVTTMVRSVFSIFEAVA